MKNDLRVLTVALWVKPLIATLTSHMSADWIPGCPTFHQVPHGCAWESSVRWPKCLDLPPSERCRRAPGTSFRVAHLWPLGVKQQMMTLLLHKQFNKE